MNLNKIALENHISNKQDINLSLGKFEYSTSDRGEGGNGLVYKGKINNIDVAIKFLVLSEGAKTNKKDRFIAEYVNVMQANTLKNVVKYISFDVFKFKKSKYSRKTYEIPAIIMKCYKGNLKKWKTSIPKNKENFEKLFNFLINTIESIHNAGIIHRDIKPENILSDENGDLVLADFGIASYNPEMFEINNLTGKKEERLANREFSAPEQESSKEKPHERMDIYAMGQVLQWFATDEPHQGTGRKKITDIEELKDLGVYDSIISRCLLQDKSKRFQSIKEIRDFIKESKKKYPMDYIQKFHNIVLSSFPKAVENKVTKISDLTLIHRFFDNLKKEIDYFGTHLYWKIKIEYLESYIKFLNIENNVLRFGSDANRLLEFNIVELYVFFTSSEHSDFILFKVEKNKPFENGNFEKYLYLEKEVTYDEFRKNIVEIEGDVIETDNILEIERKEDVEWVLISTNYSNSFEPNGGRKLTEKLFEDIQNNTDYQSVIDNYSRKLAPYRNHKINDGGSYE